MTKTKVRGEYSVVENYFKTVRLQSVSKSETVPSYSVIATDSPAVHYVPKPPDTTTMAASYAVPVRRASVLPAASLRFSLATEALAVRLTVPAVGSVEDLTLPELSRSRISK